VILPCSDGPRTDGGHKIEVACGLTWDKVSGLYKKDEDDDLGQECDTPEAQKHRCDCGNLPIPNASHLLVIRDHNIID